MAKRPRKANASSRRQRLAAALRENLKRRKAQARGRAARGAFISRGPSENEGK